MDYKKIIRGKQLRFKILTLLKFVPDKLMISFQYRIRLNRKLNWIKPERFTEQLQCYKLNHRNPLMTKCADKLQVREYIKEKNLEDLLVKLYQVADKPEDIVWDNLPEKFVIKTTNGSGTNILIKDKKNIDFLDINQKLKKWLRQDYYVLGREWSYKNIQPKIIIEEYLEETTENLNQFEGINDYKFLCFNGKVVNVVFDVDRHTQHKRNIYDLEWNLINVKTDCPNITETIEKPEGLSEMIEIAKILCEEFPFVRVDLYWINGKIYFGELTFYPWSGYVQYTPDSFDFDMGEYLK